MLSILYREYLEHRLTFALMALAGLLSLVALAWFRVFDNGTAIFLLFLVEGPLLLYVMVHHSMYGEFTAGTLPFLIGLPLSRTRIWLAKLLAALLFAALLNGIFLAMAWGFGATPGLLNLREIDRFVFRNTATVLAVPLLVVAVGMFTTLLLPEGGALLAIVFITTSLVIGVASQALTGVNLFLLESLVIAGLLFVSWYSFTTGNLFAPWRLALRVVVVTAFTALAATLAWAGLDRLAEDAVRLEPPLELGGRISADGRFLHTALRQQTPVWDPIADHSLPCPVEIDLATGRASRIGRRTTAALLATPDGRGLFVADPWVWPGAAARPGLYFLDLNAEKPATFIDYDSSPVALLPDGVLIYTREAGPREQRSLEICRWQAGQGSQVMTALPGRAYRAPVLVPPLAALLLPSAASDQPSRLLSVKNGEVLPVPLPPQTRLSAVGTDFAIFHTAGPEIDYYTGAEYRYFRIDASGTRRDLPAIPPNGRIEDILPDGELVVRQTKWFRSPQGSLTSDDTLLIASSDAREGATPTPIASYSSVFRSIHVLPEGTEAIIRTSDRGIHRFEVLALHPAAQPPRRSLDLPDRHFTTVIPRPGGVAWFYGLNARGEGEMWEADLRQGTCRQRWTLSFQ